MASVEEQYGAAWDLFAEQSKNDPVSEPYKSKYASREIFEELKSCLNKKLDEYVDEQDLHKTQSRLGIVIHHLGIIAVDTEEISTGEEYLLKALGLVDDVGVAPTTVNLAVSCHNQLGILWCQRSDIQKAKEHLDHAADVYHHYHKQTMKSPATMHSLFAVDSDKMCSDESGSKALEKLHTHTLYYLAQVYGHLDMPDKSAAYCHSTLQRQLASKEYDPVDWAINAATLSHFYVTKNRYRSGRHLLAAATKVLTDHEPEINTSQSELEDNIRIDNLRKFWQTSFAECVPKYCSIMVKDSDWEKYLQDNTFPKNTVWAHYKIQKGTFAELEVSDVEADVPATLVQEFSEARPLFLTGLRRLTEAREFYTMNDHATDHVAITQEMSRLYKNLAFFEPSEERCCKMHKRRIDLLSALIPELNPQFYLLVCRQLWYEIAETYTTMMDAKTLLINNSGDASADTIQTKKINRLATSSMQNFLHYLDSMKNHSTGEQPEKYNEDSVRPALVAWFHLGRLWGKLICSDNQTRLHNLAQSLTNYKRVVQYCDTNPECQQLMTQELAICREMVQLLPLKMERIRLQI
ncbi:unnamed protein product, partial [Meganyctiphanes norvegica]